MCIIKSYNTAPRRTKPSRTFKLVQSKVLPGSGITSVLDYGCGFGYDVEMYRSLGLLADGYDSHLPFGWVRPSRQYDLVTSSFVLNVVPSLLERESLFKDVNSFLVVGSPFFLTGVGFKYIKSKALRCGWKEFNDGFISSQSMSIFQKGLSPDDISSLANSSGFMIEDYNGAFTSTLVWFLLKKVSDLPS